MNRRSLLILFGLAPVAAVAAKLPLVKAEPFNLTATQVTERLAVYGRSPAMDALPEQQALARLMKQYLEVLGDGSACDMIEWDNVREEFVRLAVEDDAWLS